MSDQPTDTDQSNDAREDQSTGHETATDTDTDTSGPGPILVPVRVLEGQSVEPGVATLLSRARVLLLGYHEVPDQTPPGQARFQFEDRATERLADVAGELEVAGATVETRLVFTHNREQSLNRVAEETGCVGTVIPNPAMRLEDVLVPLRSERSLERVAGLTGDLLAGLDVGVTLYRLEREDEETSGRVLERARELLEARGVDPDLIETRVDTSLTPVRTIVNTASEYDAVVMGESDPSVTTFVFGETAAEVAERFHGPVLVVRRQSHDERPDEPTYAVDRETLSETDGLGS
ncbi:universal stress protein [Natronobiforma cellulositropha]|uniref:universal stress protein n=1 Tax=Natronobiforma cellulositropha TaxID=1679076 RepID=UPI0021D5C1F3|nr:universal stress protein [Natronobiforma cellulositropha]